MNDILVLRCKKGEFNALSQRLHKGRVKWEQCLRQPPSQSCVRSVDVTSAVIGNVDNNRGDTLGAWDKSCLLE
jgi:hypothetical protein